SREFETSRSLREVLLSADGKTLYALDGGILVWPTAPGSSSTRIEPEGPYSIGFAVAPDGKTLATVHDDQTLRLIEPGAGRCLHICRGGGAYVATAAFSPDGKLAVSGSHDR